MTLLRNASPTDREAVGLENRRFRDDYVRGTGGLRLCREISASRDEMVQKVAQRAWEELGAPASQDLADRIAIVAHGGYGRSELCPWSDLDLLILAEDRDGQASEFSKRVVRDLFDAGLTVGHGVSSPSDACALALSDPLFCTSVADARRLAGNPGVFDRFRELLRRRVRGRRSALLAAVVGARNEERLRYGETVFLLEPNVKRSRGALRDVQLIRWVGFLRHDAADLPELSRLGALPDPDREAVEEALEFLLRVRQELQFHAGRASDVLDRAEQLRIADAFGYQAGNGMLAVERFMRDYFLHTNRVSHIASQFVTRACARHRWTQIVTAMLGHRIEGYHVGPAGLVAGRAEQAKLASGLPAIMHLVDLANAYNQPIAPATWEIVREAVRKASPVPDPLSCERFLSLLSRPPRLGPLLSDLHDVGLLERFIPAFGHARGLLQFNQYHKYTVDEHCLRATAAAADFSSDDGPFGHFYRPLNQKRILHLALLIHDLGKGQPIDHIKAGEGIAESVGQRLGLCAEETATLRFLVANHQLLSHAAFRRDTSDEAFLGRLAAMIGSPEMLDMLVVMTAADMSAVGPDVWNPWKAEVLLELRAQILPHLAGRAATVEQRCETRRHEAAASLGSETEDPWFVEMLHSLPESYLSVNEPPSIAEDLRLLHGLNPNEVLAKGHYVPETGAMEFTIATHESIAPGIFHRLTGALTGQGLEILAAQINTLLHGRVIDRFWAVDPHLEGPVPKSRIDQICQSLTDALKNHAQSRPVFRRRLSTPLHHAIGKASAVVRIDNVASDRFTILDVFAHDRPGLLYALTSRIYELGLSVYRAKIATNLDQVVDVFYVTDLAGCKIEYPERLEEVRRELTFVAEGNGE